MTNNYSLTVALLTICVMSTMASSLRGGTLTVHMDINKKHGGIVDNVQHQDVQFDFVATHINRGEFSWDNVWSFAELSSGDFKLYDQEGDVVLVHLHEGQQVTKNLREILGTNANSDVGTLETIASHIGNSVDKAFLQKREAHLEKEANRQSAASAEKAGEVAAEVAAEVAQEVAQEVAEVVANDVTHKLLTATSREADKQKEADRQRAAAIKGGKVAVEVAHGVAQEVAKAVARNVTHQLLNTTTGEFKGFEKNSWKTKNEKAFSPEMNGFKTMITSKISG